MRHNEREIKFIRMEDAVRTVGQLNGERTLNSGPQSTFFTQGTRTGIRVLWVLCGLDEACILSGGRVRQIPSPRGVGGETGYTAQGDLKPFKLKNMGVEKTIRVWFFCSCIPRPSLVLPAHLSLGHHKGYLTLPLQTSLSWHLDISVRSSLCFIEGNIVNGL